LEGELSVAGRTFGGLSDGVVVRIEGRWHAFQLQTYTSSTRPRAILQGPIASDLAFAASIASTHDLETFVPVVFVNEYILFGVRSSGGCGSGLGHGEKTEDRSDVHGSQGSGRASVEGCADKKG
jgi:hypothetical protein